MLLASVAALLLAAGPAAAQDAPRSFAASPDVYRVVAENPQYKVIEVTWKAGQRDKAHGHPASAVYYLTDCSLRLHLPDGSYRDAAPKAGFALVQQPIASHSVENRGTGDCRLVMFEPS
jgi:quercetin dioxygenase-like cupin family protein